MKTVRCHSSLPILKYNPHMHTDFEIVCQIEGEVYTEADGKSFVMKPGDVLLIPPGIHHSGRSSSPFLDRSIRIRDTEFRTMTVLHDAHGDIAALLLMIERLLTERSSGYEKTADIAVDLLLAIIRAELGASSSPAVEVVKNTLYENIGNPDFSLSDCIRETGFAEDYFRRTFKKETGKTPLHYLTDLRIERAKRLLTEEKLYTVESVAIHSGYADPLYFSTAFRKHTGVSPRAYRNGALTEQEKKD